MTATYPPSPDLLADLQHRVKQGLDQPQAVQALLAAMLYSYPHELSLPLELERIPPWLLDDYVAYLLQPPMVFQTVGEGDRYCVYMQTLVSTLHHQILNQPDSPLWQHVADLFTQSANLLPCYFNTQNLRDLYSQRGDIIEATLRRQGHALDWEMPLRTGDKVRLGILSAHLNPSAETAAALPAYEHLSREFEVILYSFAETGHPLEEYCKSRAEAFRLLPPDLSAQVQLMRADTLDVLYISTNVTAYTNAICRLVAHRLARVQGTSGGSVVTTGLSHMDYFLSGELTDPSLDAAAHYREQLVQLPATAQCFSYPQSLPAPPRGVTRASLGLAEDAVVFASAANFFKLVPDLMQTWVQVLAAVPKAVLLLFPYGPNWSSSYPKAQFQAAVTALLAEHHMPPQAVVMADPQPTPNREELKEFLRVADVYLDSFPFAGTTSLIEPLELGLPVLTQTGPNFRNAMGAGIVQALGVPEISAALVAESESAYRQRAIALGTQPELRKTLGDRIQQAMRQVPPFLDSRRYGAHLGQVFRDLLDAYEQVNLVQAFSLQTCNVVAFPDWAQPEELLFEELLLLVQASMQHSQQHPLTVLLDATGIDPDDADMALSSVMMQLLAEEGLELPEDAMEFAVLPPMEARQWQQLVPHLTGRLALPHENHRAIAAAGVAHLPVLAL
ncbi:MAG: hypothetical protein KME20_07185 [Kaiparowitsia implicata GSE-PSE-MK54-09C]|jgi:predicted O-linked N-acetylglucosamine transferase (SPINDLY family)|nr:hypothetical protein [Kaiparowitsia implicata GSE-PSE-MK54-09C]